MYHVFNELLTVLKYFYTINIPMKITVCHSYWT